MTPPERLTLKSIASDFFQDLTQADKGLWGTIVQLTLRPKRVLDTFLYKNRQQFSRPTRYLIFCLSIAAFQFIAVQWRYDISVVEYNETLEDGTEINMSAIEEFAQGFASGGEEEAISVKEMAAYASYALAALIPAYAFLYFFLFPGRGLNYAESLAGAVYLHGHFLLVTALLSLPFLAFSDIADFAWAKSWIETGTTVLLFAFVLRMFLITKRDLFWMAPKLLLAAVWAVLPFIFLGTIMAMIMSLVLPEMKPVPYGIFLFSVLVFPVVILVASRVLLAFRTHWPRRYVWVPTALVVLGAYTLLAFSLLKG